MPVLVAVVTGQVPRPGDEAAVPMPVVPGKAGMALEARALDLGCTDEQMSALMRERADRLRAESSIGQLLIEGLREGGEGFFE